MDITQSFGEHLQAGPAWVYYWVLFMGVMFMLSVPFSFVRKEARWVLLVLLITLPFGSFLFTTFGYERILGLSHLIIWTPLLVYLWRRRKSWRVRETLSGKWLFGICAVIAISLAFDVVDVARYMLGERM